MTVAAATSLAAETNQRPSREVRSSTLLLRTGLHSVRGHDTEPRKTCSRVRGICNSAIRKREFVQPCAGQNSEFTDTTAPTCFAIDASTRVTVDPSSRRAYVSTNPAGPLTRTGRMRSSTDGSVVDPSEARPLKVSVLISLLLTRGCIGSEVCWMPVVLGSVVPWSSFCWGLEHWF